MRGALGYAQEMAMGAQLATMQAALGGVVPRRGDVTYGEDA